MKRFMRIIICFSVFSSATAIADEQPILAETDSAELVSLVAFSTVPSESLTEDELNATGTANKKTVKKVLKIILKQVAKAAVGAVGKANKTANYITCGQWAHACTAQ